MLADPSIRRFSATGMLKVLARPALHFSRELPLRFEMIGQGGRLPRVACLPSTGREGAALLRIYNVVQALRPLGWCTLVLLWRLTLAQRRRILATYRPDVVLMQGARHDLNRPGLYSGAPVIFDMDDADFHLPHLSEPVRRAMPEVAAVIAGSRYVADWCRSAGAGEARVVWTGTPVSGRPRPAQASRPPVVAWAQTRPATYVREAD